MTVPPHALRLVMRTRRSGSTATFEDSRRSRASLQCRHLDGNGLQLAWRQLPQQGNDSLHVRLAHFSLLDESAHMRHDTQYPLRQAHCVSQSTDFANRAFIKHRINPDGLWKSMFGRLSIFFMLRMTPSAVSYTHLDVYKRQVLGFAMMGSHDAFASLLDPHIRFSAAVRVDTGIHRVL